MIDTLSALDSIQVPGDIRRLPYRWPADPDWKSRLAPPATRQGRERDDRVERHSEPQYERPEEKAMARNGCPSCVFVD